MRQRKGTMISLIFIVAFLVMVLMLAGRNVQAQINEGNARISELQQQTEAEEKRTTEIQAMQENMQSDEYKEEIAKEKLGMIKDNEIIFKESGSKSESK